MAVSPSSNHASGMGDAEPADFISALYDRASMETLRQRGLHVAGILLLLIALGATAYPAGLVRQLEAAATSIHAGRPDLAVPALVNALALEPNLKEAHLRVAEGSLLAADTDLAERYLSQVSEGDSPLHCLQLDLALREGSVREAIDQLPGSDCPEQVQALLQEAETMIAAGDFEDAEGLLGELLGALPPTAQPSSMMGTLLAIRDPESAISYLRLASDLDPALTDEASEIIDTIEGARTESSLSYTLAQVGQLFARRGKWILAAEAFRNALAHDPDYTEARAYYGLALDRSGQDGLAHLQLAVEEAPDAALPLMFLGKHWLTGGDPELAIDTYEQAAVLAPEDPLVAVDLGAAYAASGDLQSARLAYEYATQLDPSDPSLWSLLAQFSLDYEVEIEEVGLPAAREAAKLLSRDAASLDRLGYTHFLLGNRTLAERFIREAIEVDNNLASAHYHRGLLALSVGDVMHGRWALATAYALDPNGRYGSLALRSLENLNQ